MCTPAIFSSLKRNLENLNCKVTEDQFGWRNLLQNLFQTSYLHQYSQVVLSTMISSKGLSSIEQYPTFLSQVVLPVSSQIACLPLNCFANRVAALPSLVLFSGQSKTAIRIGTPFTSNVIQKMKSIWILSVQTAQSSRTVC